MKRFCIAAILLLIASVFSAGAFAAPHADPMMTGDLKDFPVMTFVAPANSAYGVYVFSADGSDVNAYVRVEENGRTIASGSGRGELCSLRLVSGTEYALHVSGEGCAVVEVARQALSRCADKPLPVAENEIRRKVIARSGDAHWYGLTAEADGILMLTCVPEDAGLAMGADLFDASGNRIAAFEELPGGACMLLALTEAGGGYAVRVHSTNAAEGGYALALHRSPAELLQALRFDVDAAAIPLSGTVDLGRVLSGKALLWVSDDPSVVRIDQNGTASGVGEGTTRVTAYGVSANASCEVTVRYVPLESLSVVSEHITLAEGDEADVQPVLFPPNASDRSLRFRSDDPSVAEVAPNGVVKGISVGETRLHVKSLDSGLECGVTVQVLPAARRYRALVVAEENYPYAQGPARRGSRTSAEAIELLLGTMEYESAAFVTRTRLDLSRAELIAEIRSAFAGATEKDVSLFYITCHGSYAGGMSFFELSDGSSLSARDLERELRKIPGSVVVLLDCCASGGAIGARSETSAFARGVSDLFANPVFLTGKYKVFCSAGLDQDSFRVAFGGDAETGMMATAFARALCDGAGWDIDRNVLGAMNADADYDGRITVGELQLYLADRVNWYLNLASSLNAARYRQSVQVYPEGDPLVLFERKS